MRPAAELDGDARVRHRACAEEGDAAEECAADVFAADLVEREANRQRDRRVSEIKQHVRDDGHYLPSESRVDDGTVRRVDG